MADSRHHQLILFDIDGTLIHSGGAGVRAMSRAFAEVCRVDNGFDGIRLAGRTDPLILADAFARLGLDAHGELTARFCITYYHCLAEELARGSGTARVMPGVGGLLDALSARPHTTVSLLTGNYREAARLKLEHFGLWRHFRSGAFGEDAADRNGLVEVAVGRARGLGMPSIGPRGVVVVGDTPLDVQCGRVNQARTIAVATGTSSAGELEASGPDAVLVDLSNTARVVTLLERFAAESSGPSAPLPPAR